MSESTHEPDLMEEGWAPLALIPQGAAVYAYEEVMHLSSLRERADALEYEILEREAERDQANLDNEIARRNAILEGFEAGLHEVRKEFAERAAQLNHRIHTEFSSIRARLIAVANEVFGRAVADNPGIYADYVARNLLPPPDDCSKLKVTLPADSILQNYLQAALSQQGFQASFAVHHGSEIVIDHDYGRVLCSPAELLENAIACRENV